MWPEWSDAVWIAFINVVLGGALSALLAIGLKWLDARSVARAIVTASKIADVDKKVDDVKAATDGMTTRLVEQGKLVATHEERERMEAEALADKAKEAEIIQRLEAARAKETVTTTNKTDHPASVAANVKVIKEDVKAVQRDVKDVKAEVTREVKEGVQQGIADAKDQAIERRADSEMDK